VELPDQIEDALIRSLAKRADDRFEVARDMRKIFEASLKEADVGLTDTARIDRADLVVPARKPQLTPLPGTTARASSGLSDELVPATSLGGKKRRAKWPWLVAAMFVLGGGGGAAYLAISVKKDKGYQPVAHISSVRLTTGTRFEDLSLLVETDGKVTPDEVAKTYRTTLEKLRAFDPTVNTRFDVLDEIIAVPVSAMCEPSAYIDFQADTDCATALGTRAGSMSHKRRYMLVVDDRPRLAEAIKAGLVSTVCAFQPATTSIAEVDKICDMTKRFRDSK
jgi:hypothetical protein